MRRRAIWVLAAVLAAAITGGTYAYTHGLGRPAGYRTEAITRGPLVAAISATGTLNAVISVQVGSQVSGLVKELYADFNSRVTKNQIIAQIDPEPFEAKVSQAQAQVEAARALVVNQGAAVHKARADLENARAALASSHAQTAKALVSVVDGRRNLGRQQDLRRQELIAQADLDAAQVALDSAVAQHEASEAQERAQAAAVTSAEAQLEVAEAMLKNAEAQVTQNVAALKQAQLDLDHTIIRAPVEGVVVLRSVDRGQTVAASLQAPTLFTIAQDLSKMQVDTNVDEADVGRVVVGQSAPFSVDAFPGRVFDGAILQVRKAPQVVQNVVTYDVIVSAANDQLVLLPGMTANVRIVTDRKEGVLRVSNTALRFRPEGVEAERPQRPGARPGAAEGERKRGEAQEAGRPGASGDRPGPGAGHGPQGGGTMGRLWLLGPDGKPRSVAVRLGITDGNSTELLGHTLGEGDQVIVSSGQRPERKGSGAAGPRLKF